jgi:hypothetical protein
MQSIFGALKNSLQNSLVLSSIMKCLDGRSLLVLKVMLLKTVVFWIFFPKP